MILVADDDRVFSRLICERLSRHGFQAMAVFDATQAVVLAMRQPFEAILLDISMPGGTGVEVLKRLKASLKTNLTPVIVITANEGDEVQAIIQSLGAERYLRKPLEFEELASVLHEVLDKRSPAASTPARKRA